MFLPFVVALSHGIASELVPGEPLPFPDNPKEATNVAQLTPRAYIPAIFEDNVEEQVGESDPIPDIWVDINDRSAVEALYQSLYLSYEGGDSGWNGDRGSCTPGATSESFQEGMLARINYFRSMSGIPALSGFRDEYNQKAQQAALMMSANRQLSHYPDSSWTCYTEGGSEGAGSSNLYLGRHGVDAITGYIYDPGSGNYAVGHRRWILYPNTQYMGTGDLPGGSGEYASNALWVFDLDNLWGARPETRDPYIAWPPPGYVPKDLIFPRWSFSYPSADFSGVQVTVTREGGGVGTTLSPVVNGYGDNTLVWELAESLPGGDVTYVVTLSNVVIDGSAQTFSYEVKGFDPAG